MRASDVLGDFEPVELCNLEYLPQRGAAIVAHKDDTWLWGERLVTVNLLSDTVYTMTLDCQERAANQTDDAARCSRVSHFDNGDTCGLTINSESSVALTRDRKAEVDSAHSDTENRAADSESSINDVSDIDVDLSQVAVEIELPARSLIVLYGAARHRWLHAIRSQHVTRRRIGVTLRELSAEFRHGGASAHVGAELLQKASSFQGISVAEFAATQQQQL